MRQVPITRCLLGNPRLSPDRYFTMRLPHCTNRSWFTRTGWACIVAPALAGGARAAYAKRAVATLRCRGVLMPVSLDRAKGGPDPVVTSTKPNSGITPKRWREILAPYSKPDNRKSLLQLA